MGKFLRRHKGLVFVVLVLLIAGLKYTYDLRREQRRTLAALEEAGRRGVPTARLAFGASGAMTSGKVLTILATEEIEGAFSLAEILASSPTDRDAPEDRRRVLEVAGAAVRRAHDLGLDHPDLNVGNILMTRAGTNRGGEPVRGEPVGSRVGQVLAFLIDLGPNTALDRTGTVHELAQAVGVFEQI